MNTAKGIVLAGGKSTRLYPLTVPFSKQLLPVYDKPMVYYPLSLLMLAGIRDILIITTPDDQPLFKSLLGDGSGFGIKLSYAIQAKPSGIAQALVIAEGFLDKSASVLALGDNLMFGDGLPEKLSRAVQQAERLSLATIFACPVKDPSQYGVVELDKTGTPIALTEKPMSLKSNLAVPGLYVYPSFAGNLARGLTPSSRGELEITDLNRVYMNTKPAGRLHVSQLSRGTAWFDMGTHESLLDAANYVEAVQRRQGLAIGCLEEIAYQNGWLDHSQVRTIAERLSHSSYGQYLKVRFVGAQEGPP